MIKTEPIKYHDPLTGTDRNTVIWTAYCDCCRLAVKSGLTLSDLAKVVGESGWIIYGNEVICSKCRAIGASADDPDGLRFLESLEFSDGCTD